MKDKNSNNQFGKFVPCCFDTILFPTNSDHLVYFTIIMAFLPPIVLLASEFEKGCEFGTIYLLVLCVLLGFLSTYYVICTWLTEPGVIPKNFEPRKNKNYEMTSETKLLQSLFQYIRRDNLETIKTSVISNHQVIYMSNNEKRTLLHIAVLMNKEQICQYLIDQGADPLCTDIYGLSPLHYSLYLENQSIAKYFIVSKNLVHNQDTILKEAKEESLLLLGGDKGKFNGAAFIPSDGNDTRPILVNGKIEHVVCCKQCNVYTPPRAFHCKSCNICIRRYDHHCPWMSTCIGLRNHKYFYLSLIYMFITLLFGITCSIWDIFIDIDFAFRNYQDPNDIVRYGLQPHIIAFIYAIFSLAVMFAITPLLYYHSTYISKNITTLEDVTARFSNQKSPYSHGFWKNWKEELFSPCPPSLATSILKLEKESNQNDENKNTSSSIGSSSLSINTSIDQSNGRSIPYIDAPSSNSIPGPNGTSSLNNVSKTNPQSHVYMHTNTKITTVRPISNSLTVSSMEPTRNSESTSDIIISTVVNTKIPSLNPNVIEHSDIIQTSSINKISLGQHQNQEELTCHTLHTINTQNDSSSVPSDSHRLRTTSSLNHSSILDISPSNLSKNNPNSLSNINTHNSDLHTLYEPHMSESSIVPMKTVLQQQQQQQQYFNAYPNSASPSSSHSAMSSSPRFRTQTFLSSPFLSTPYTTSMPTRISSSSDYSYTDNTLAIHLAQHSV